MWSFIVWQLSQFKSWESELVFFFFFFLTQAEPHTPNKCIIGHWLTLPIRGIASSFDKHGDTT